MEGLTRRGLQMSAAAAGFAALGAGFAGPAVAAPQLPAVPGAEALETSVAPAASTLLDTLAEPDAATLPGPTELPPLFSFEIPRIAADAGNPLTTVANVDPRQVEGPDLKSVTGGDNRVGATPLPEAVREYVDLVGHAVAERGLHSQKIG